MPSGLKAAAMVDLGAGQSGQYEALHLRRKSLSTQRASSLLASPCPSSLEVDVLARLALED
eukprot:scaffold364511_cov47-Prasinocladus_malaysianus.AAC.1